MTFNDKNPTTSAYRYLFGPVASRRLGRSLGVDVVPYKVCTYDCIYCEVGRTTRLTAEREEYVAPAAILDELTRWLAGNQTPDYVTVTGAGEPTLHSGLGEIIRGIKRISGAPVAVLTNGSLLYRTDVQDDLLEADLVVPSLDAGTDEELQRVNRPAAALSLNRLYDGLRVFRQRFHGQLWLEVLLVGGITDSDESVRRIAAMVAEVKPDRVQLNTVVRPPADPHARPVTPERLAELAAMFTPRAEVIAPTVREPSTTAVAVTRSDILALLRRRPCPIEEIVSGLGIPRDEAERQLAALEEAGLIRRRTQNGVEHFSA
ncbi:MAG: radical SAM protein [Chitinivibrionales bacterium]|nr:radical SAM protein [Chitinivibrionales bacterium]